MCPLTNMATLRRCLFPRANTPSAGTRSSREAGERPVPGHAFASEAQRTGRLWLSPPFLGVRIQQRGGWSGQSGAGEAKGGLGSGRGSQGCKGWAGWLPGPVAHCKASTGQLTATAVPTPENQGREPSREGQAHRRGTFLRARTQHAIRSSPVK